MRNLIGRVKAMEAEGPANLSPAVRAWLGHRLSVVEQNTLDAGANDVAGEIDASNWSQEAKVWLGVD